MLLVIKGEMCDFNTFQNSTRSSRFEGSKIKKDQTGLVAWSCRAQKIEPITEYPVEIIFKWYSKDNRKDLDNVAFAKKFILDGLVTAGILENDSRKFISGFIDEFYIDAENPRTEIEI